MMLTFYSIGSGRSNLDEVFGGSNKSPIFNLRTEYHTNSIFFCQYTSGRFCQIKLGTSSSRCEIESHINYFAGYLFDFVIVTYSSLFVCQLMLVIFGDLYMK